jgi:hypothetical protein
MVIEFDSKGNGAFHFICVDTEIDCKVNEDLDRAEFTLHGSDEIDETFGRWCVEVEGSDL